MTGQEAGHSRFDELAAGYALDALEPTDVQLFVAHAGQCSRCRQLTADFREVAGALAETSPRAEPSDSLGDRILAAALAGAAGPAGSPGGTQPGDDRASRGPEEIPEPALGGTAAVIPLRGRPARRWQRAAAVAAAAALVAGGGIWVGLAAAGGGSRPPLAACGRPHACAQIELTATRTGRPVATVIVRNGVAWMEPTAITANPSDEIYVLWQITGAQTPLAVGSFDIRPGGHGPVRIGDLAVPYSGTWAFAISLEHGRTIPVRPSRPVALGEVS